VIAFGVFMFCLGAVTVSWMDMIQRFKATRREREKKAIPKKREIFYAPSHNLFYIVLDSDFIYVDSLHEVNNLETEEENDERG
jgi:hypothetical protein